MLVSAAALAMAIGTAVPSMAEDEGCDTEKLAEVVKASGVSAGGVSGAIEVVAYYAPNACAVGRRSIAMVRGMMSDAYGAADDADGRAAALMAAKTMGENAGMGCDKDAAALLVLDVCTLDDVQKALADAM
jgi:hypothetical protein